MKLAHKLLLAPLLTAFVLLGVGQANSWLNGREAAANQQAHHDQIKVHKLLGGNENELTRLHAEVYRTMTLVASLDDAKVKSVRASLAQRAAAIKSSLAGLVADSRNADLKRQLADATGLIDQYVKHADGAIDLATVDANTGVAAMQNADATFTSLGKVISQLAVIAEADTNAASDTAAARSRQLNWGLALAGLIFASVAIALAYATQRRFVAEIVEASRVAGQVALGHLNQVIESRRSDEVGELVRGLAAMQAQLRTLVGDVRASADNISLASSEVASGNTDLSQRTEQTAANLQQAASSLDQLTATVRQSADSASTANQLAASAAKVAERGGSVVSQVVSTMNEINVASKKISDIIAVIDGIAFQTNILALNAAVEAARAGEQGRGFAVVATEVRSLAQRSAQAAKEIKGLIGASVEKVETGSKLVADAGSTMSEIVASVQRVSDIIGEITAAASEQSQGIGQVNVAVTQLDQMTQQNAALVEQSAAAAESLKDQAGKLTGVMALFKLQPAGA